MSKLVFVLLAKVQEPSVRFYVYGAVIVHSNLKTILDLLMFYRAGMFSGWEWA